MAARYGMRFKSQNFLNFCLAALLLVLWWPTLAGLAQNTNPPAVEAAPPTNHVRDDVFARFIPDQSNVTPDWVDRLAAQHPVLKEEIFGNELWKYLASLIYILAAFYAAKLLDHLTRAVLKRWNKQNATRFDHLLLELLKGPVKVVMFMILLHIGLDIFTWPPRVEVILRRGFVLVTAGAITYLVLKLVDLALDYWRERSKSAELDRTFDDQLFPLIRRSLKVFVIIVAALVTAQNLNVNVTAALASLSIGGLAVGLAAQDTLANLFGTIAILLDKPFRVGDRVNVGLPERIMEGTVVFIGLRSSRFRSATGSLITIPNKAVANATIINISRRVSLCTEMNLALASDAPPDKLQRAVAIVHEVLEANPVVADVRVTMSKFQDTVVNLEVSYSWKGLDQARYLAGTQELNLALKQRFDTDGIKLASPVQFTYLK